MFKELLTEPKEHNPNDFIYLVYSLIDLHGNSISPQKMRDKVNRVRDPNQFYSASMIAHLDKESAKKRIGYIREVYQIGTFGDIGIIVDPAYNDLVKIAWNCDLGSPLDPKELENFVQEHKGKIKNPLTLLTQTRGPAGFKYNELILKGDENTVVKGVFFKPQYSRTEYEGKQLGAIVSEIMQSEVPIIELPATPINNYDNIKDPKEREKRRALDDIKSQSESMEAHLEFYRPELFRDRHSYERIKL